MLKTVRILKADLTAIRGYSERRAKMANVVLFIAIWIMLFGVHIEIKWKDR